MATLQIVWTCLVKPRLIQVLCINVSHIVHIHMLLLATAVLWEPCSAVWRAVAGFSHGQPWKSTDIRNYPVASHCPGSVSSAAPHSTAAGPHPCLHQLLPSWHRKDHHEPLGGATTPMHHRRHQPTTLTPTATSQEGPLPLPLPRHRSHHPHVTGARHCCLLVPSRNVTPFRYRKHTDA
jgi:hypothetical protein